jgi:hypothetical protein
VASAEADPSRVRRDGNRARLMAARYDWDDVAVGYEELCLRMAARDFPRSRPSGRRLRRGPAASRLPQPSPRPANGATTPGPRRSETEPARTPLRVAVADPVCAELPTARAAQS